MQLEVVGSGSSGNLYILKSSTGETLVLDMGFPFAILKRALSFDLSNTFLLICHFHSDHLHKTGVKEAMKAGIDVYALKSTLEHSGLENERRAKFIEPDVPFTVGDFWIMPFEVNHNVPCVGFVICHPECSPICYLTDSGPIDVVFPGVKIWFVEANHDSNLLMDRVFDSKTSAYLGNRVLQDHMSIDNCIKLLEMQDMSEAEVIVLLHLSSGNSNPGDFKTRVEQRFGRPTHIAAAGLKIDLSLF